MCMGGFPPPSNIDCPTIWLHSDTTYLEIAPDPTGWGPIPRDYSCIPHVRHQSQVRVVTCVSDPVVVNLRFPWPLLWVQLLCYSVSQNWGKHFMFTSLLNDVIKVTDNSQTEWYFGRVLGESWVQEFLSPWSWGNMPPCSRLCSPFWHYRDFMEASSHRHSQLLTPFPALLPLLEDEE